MGNAGAGPRIEVRLDDQLERAWPLTGATGLVERRFDDGAPAATIDWDDELGYMIFAAGYGHFRISAGGSLIECSPEPVEAWEWQRYLIGQVLPISAVLDGRGGVHGRSGVRGCQGGGLGGGSGGGEKFGGVHLGLSRSG